MHMCTIRRAEVLLIKYLKYFLHLDFSVLFLNNIKYSIAHIYKEF